MALRLSLALQRHRVGWMPPYRGASRRWDAALTVGGDEVYAEVFGGHVELRQAAFVYMLGWVTPPSLARSASHSRLQYISYRSHPCRISGVEPTILAKVASMGLPFSHYA